MRLPDCRLPAVVFIALALVGWLKGGLGHVNIIGSVIFAGMSGTAIADAAGLVTEYQRNTAGNVTEIRQYPANAPEQVSIEQLSYDAAGRLISKPMPWVSKVSGSTRAWHSQQH